MTNPTPICPKCGYDQSGEIATWENQCPMEGRCPECGLALKWAEVFDPVLNDLAWYIEHAKWPWGMIRRTIPTLKKLIFPHIYWREVGVDTRIRFSFLVVWILMLTTIVHVLVAIPVGMGSWRNQGNWGSGLSIRQYIERHGMRCVPEEMFNAVALPFAHFDYSGGWHQLVWGDFGRGMLIATLLFVGAFVGLTSVWLVILLALPVSRSKIQLRTAHLIRAWVNSLLIAILNVEAFRGITGLIGWVNGGRSIDLFAYSFLGFVFLSIVWIQWFWIAALKGGWSIRPVWLIGTLGIIASLLAGFIPIMYASVYA